MISQFTSTAFKKETDYFDWDKIIEKLKINGYNQLKFKFNDKDELVFDRVNTLELRCLLSELIEISDKRHTIMRDTLDENDRLKWQLKDADFLAKRYEETIKNLNETLLDLRQRLNECEGMGKKDRNNNNNNSCDWEVMTYHQPVTVSDDSQQSLSESRRIIISRYHNLERICEDQREQINSLQLRLNRLNSLEGARIARQKQIFHQLKHKSPNSYNALDKRLLDIIDSYESKILQMEKHLMFFSNLGFCLPFDDMGINIENVPDSRRITGNESDEIRNEVSDQYKHLISKLQGEIENIRNEKKGIEDKYELLKLEYANRPTPEELKDMIEKLREYRRLLNIHNIRPEKEKAIRRKLSKHDHVEFYDYPNKIEDIEFLPLKGCQRYLMDLCTHLNSRSVLEAFENLSELLRMNTEYPIYVSLANRLVQIIDNPTFADCFRAASHGNKNSSVVNRYEELVQTLDIWCHELITVPQLEGLIQELFHLLFPTKNNRVQFKNAGIAGLVEQVTALLEACQPTVSSKKQQQQQMLLTAGQAQSLMEHFQNLFDCPSPSSAYTHMNYIYSHYCEMTNIISSLKRVLNIESQKGYACLIAEVEGLLAISDLETKHRFDDMELMKDVEVLVKKLEHYEEFVPLFQSFVEDILHELGLDSLDQVLPKIQSFQISLPLS